MDPYRSNRLNQSILEVLSGLLTTAVKDPRVGFVTINSVKVNRDHSVAEVYFSVMGDNEEERAESFLGLKKARKFMQSKLTRVLGLRMAPNLRFIYDDSIEKAIAMDTVFEDMKEKGEFLDEDARRKQLCLDDLEPPMELLKGIKEAKSLWIVPHFNPDPDAIGSALALGEALRLMGKQVRVLSYPDPPVGNSDMPNFEYVLESTEAEEVYLDEKPDTLVLVDCHRIDRCGPLEDLLDRFEKRLCVDHHLVSGRKAPEPGWVEDRACSTCTLVYRLITILSEADEEYETDSFELDTDMGYCLYAGLINDTGGFRFSNTLPLTFELARRLSVLGVDTAEVGRATFYRNRRQGVDLMQRVLSTFDYHAEGRILMLHATQEMVKESGGMMSDTEGFVNIATAVDGVQYVGFLKELDNKTWRASLRVRGEGDVQVIAANYGGGGHKKASGCTLEGSIEEVSAILVQDLMAALNR
jgi:bifunctional oligoribonuclease and PAP phosphatase NrnA